MDIPKPHDFRQLDTYAPSKDEAKKVETKREFVRTPHLNQKPFKTSELAQLRNALKKGGKR